MSKICYTRKRFSTAHTAIIEQAQAIVEEFNDQGYTLTLRQLYYQFVARALIENTTRSYKRLGGIINDARLAGKIDWRSMEDRTRQVKMLSHWASPEQIVETCADSFTVDHWAGQRTRVEVWVEKEALAEVVGNAARAMDCPWFCCRGYSSASALWEAAQRHIRYRKELGAHRSVIIHLGDHDPSGMDMTRDIFDRMALFVQKAALAAPVVRRIALNMDQVEEFNPPPNPAKVTDSRAANYIAEYGPESWELDALEPKVLEQLISDTIHEYCDMDLYEEMLEEENAGRETIQRICDNWDEIVEGL